VATPTGNRCASCSALRLKLLSGFLENEMDEIVELNETALWPLADSDEHANGWILSCIFLRAVKAACKRYGENVSMEEVEAVLLAAQITALMSPNAADKERA
jgi:hypothetical protein